MGGSLTSKDNVIKFFFVYCETILLNYRNKVNWIECCESRSKIMIDGTMQRPVLPLSQWGSKYPCKRANVWPCLFQFAQFLIIVIRRLFDFTLPITFAMTAFAMKTQNQVRLRFVEGKLTSFEFWEKDIIQSYGRCEQSLIRSV